MSTASARALAIRTLGGAEITCHGQPLHLRGRKAAALLFYLAVEQGQRHSRESLLGLLWPEMKDGPARNNLRVALARLRRRLPAGTLGSNRHYVWFNGDDERRVQVDFHHFRALLATGRAATGGSAPRGQWQEAAAHLYRGAFLANFHVAGCPAFDEWLYVWRERLHVHAVALLTELVQIHEEQGDLEAACAHARRQLELDPLYEPAHRALMRLYGRQQRHMAAQTQYERLRLLLEQELGVEPDGETLTIWQALPAGNTDQAVRDAGEPGAAAMAPGQSLLVVADLEQLLARVPALPALLHDSGLALLVTSQEQLRQLADTLGKELVGNPGSPDFLLVGGGAPGAE